MVNFLGSSIFPGNEEEEKKKLEESALMRRLRFNKRIIKNKKAAEYEPFEPIMVYSTLLEYDDKTAIRPYQKLSFRRNESYSLNTDQAKKKKKKDKKKSDKKSKKNEAPGLLIDDQDDLFGDEDMIEVKDLEEINVEEF